MKTEDQCPTDDYAYDRELKKKGLDPAYPRIAFDNGGRVWEVANGLTKREYFAAMAMQGIISVLGESALHYGGPETAVTFADELIKQLNK